MNKIAWLLMLASGVMVTTTQAMIIIPEASVVASGGAEALTLINEKPVEGIPSGNLSGLTFCQNKLLAVSDKVDKTIYQLKEEDDKYKAQTIALPAIPKLKNNRFSIRQITGNYLDFEGLACDGENRLYLASEFNDHVLIVSADLSKASWILFPENILSEAKKANLLIRKNAKLEGLAINPEGDSLWLIAERENRGIIHLKKENNEWVCRGCILSSEGQKVTSPKPLGAREIPVDFGDATYFKGKLFTLERLEHKVCRRQPETAKLEKCWSFQDALIGEKGHQYNFPFGQAEALWLDDNSAWIGIDNNMAPNERGDIRPIIYHFKVPKGGWMNE